MTTPPEWPAPRSSRKRQKRPIHGIERFGLVTTVGLSLTLLGYGAGDVYSHIVSTHPSEFTLPFLNGPLDTTGAVTGIVAGAVGTTIAIEGTKLHNNSIPGSTRKLPPHG